MIRKENITNETTIRVGHIKSIFCNIEGRDILTKPSSLYYW